MSSYIDVEGARIAYEDRGEGFPLVAIHGYYPDRRLMTGAFEPLFDAEGRAFVPASASCGKPEGGPTRPYRRIYPDLPFMGESGDPEWMRDSDDMLRIVAAFIRALVPEGPFLVAGESYGGYLARGLAKEFGGRVEGLAFLCPMIVASKGERALPSAGRVRVEPGYGEGADPADLSEFETFTVVRDRHTFARSAIEVLSGCKIARASALEAIREDGFAYRADRLRGLDPDGREAADSEAFDAVFDRPALFALGRDDLTVGWRDALRLADRYPNASYAILDLAGHNLQIEQAGLFGALVGEWLGRCEDWAPRLPEADRA